MRYAFTFTVNVLSHCEVLTCCVHLVDYGVVHRVPLYEFISKFTYLTIQISSCNVANCPVRCAIITTDFKLLCSFNGLWFCKSCSVTDLLVGLRIKQQKRVVIM